MFGTPKTKPVPSPQRNTGKAFKENVAPAPDSTSPIFAKSKSLLLPQPPPSNLLKRKLCLDTAGVDASSCSDSDVQVIVRVRSLNKDEEVGGMIVNKIFDDSVSVGGHIFTFDSIADIESTQAWKLGQGRLIFEKGGGRRR